MKSSCAALAAALLALGPAAAIAAPQCATALSSDAAARLQTAWLDTLKRGDRTAYERLTAPDFTAFEGGKTYTRDGFLAFAHAVQASGVALQWSVTEPRLEADCDLAVLSYVNSGSITPPGQATIPMRWLEFAAFRRSGDQWVAVMAASQRVAGMGPAPAAAAAAAPPPR